MKELTEIAAQYAAEKTNEVMINAIAKAYADGYRDGYKDREEEIPVNLRSNATEYVDLGLPSGTLWAKDYEKEGDGTLYLPYGKACQLSIPTEEQWKELIESCYWKYAEKYFECIGPNGNVLYFETTGMKEGENTSHKDNVVFWILDDEEQKEKKAADIYNMSYKINVITWHLFSGYKLPIRLVRTK